MVELNVVQIGQIEVECGVESEFGDVECGDKGRDGHDKETIPAGIPFNTKLLSLHPLPNQSKPIVQLPLFSLLITSRYTLITSSYNSHNL